MPYNTADSAKLAIFFKNYIKNIYSKIKLDKLSAKKILSTIKIGLSTAINIFWGENDEFESLPDINLIKLLFEGFENKLLSLPGSSQIKCIKFNEILYLPKKNFENFKILSEKEGLLRNTRVNKLIKIRIITNQSIKINFEHQNLYEKIKEEKIREVNFFGLLLRVSKDFLTPYYNMIMHISGGGFFSQSSESHLNYLTKWANKTDSVIISLDYKLTNDNKYPILLDECIQAYELILNYSNKLYGFNINKLVIYCDTVGSLVVFDIIKHSIKNNLKKPDSVVFTFPYPNLLIEDLNIHTDPLTFFGIDDNFMEVPLHLKLQDIFLDHNSIQDEKFGKKSFKDDERLNFFLSDPNIVSQFPKTLIISSANEPFREECKMLTEFLIRNKVEVKIENLVYYFNGFLQIQSLSDTNYDKSLEYALNFILESFKPNIPIEVKHKIKFASNNS